MTKPEDPTGIEQAPIKEVTRSNVVYEAWIGDVNNPKVYLLLLRKKGKGWWETPGGQIDRELTSKHSLFLESMRELEEEAPMGNPKSSEYETLGFHVLGHVNDLTVYENSSIIDSATPFLIREGNEKLPEVDLSKSNAEHDGYVWIDVTDMHADLKTPDGGYSNAYRRSSVDFRHALNDSGQNKISPTAGHILTISDMAKLNLSSVAKRIFNHYADHAINLEPPKGFRRPTRP